MPNQLNRSLLLLAPLLLALVAACSSDNPTEPQQNPVGPSTASGQAWNISVNASDRSVSSGDSAAITVTVSVRRASDGVKPANGTTVVVTTSLGEFNSQGSGATQGTLSLFDGVARINFFPGNVPGTARVTAQLDQSRGSTNITIQDGGAFFLTSVQPNIGGPNGGEQVVIRGGGFLEPVRVTFGGSTAVVESVTSTRIRVRTPATTLSPGQTQPVTVAVTNNLNGPTNATDQLVNAFTYTLGGSSNEPRAFGVTPGTGPNEGGTTVVITGENFESPVQVIFGQGTNPNNFNGVEATVQSVTPTQIIVTSPSATNFGQGLLNQRADILIRNINTGLVTIATDAFQYGPNVLVTEIAPNSGPASGDQLVDIFGQGFVEPLQVRLGSVVDPQPLVSVTPTQITVRTLGAQTNSCGDISGPVIVTLLDTGNENTQGPTYVYQVTSDGPRISGLNPTQGSANGGTPVTITGQNFYSNTEVTFGGRAGNISSIGSGSISVTSPFIPDAELLIEACDDNADGTQGERYIDTPVEVLVKNLSTQCEATFPNGFVYVPTNTVCRNDVGAVTPPTASFTFTVTNAATFTVQFNDTSNPAATAWSWDIDNDGSIDYSTQFPIHSFPAAGSYSVALTVSNAGGTDSTVQVVTVP